MYFSYHDAVLTLTLKAVIYAIPHGHSHRRHVPIHAVGELDRPGIIIVLIAVCCVMSACNVFLQLVASHLPLSSSLPSIMMRRVSTARTLSAITKSHAAVSIIAIALATHMMPSLSSR